MLDALELTGRSRGHVVELEVPRCTLHRDVVLPFLALRGAALADGIDLVPASSFRDFARQRSIWNGKFRGERPMLDRSGGVLDGQCLAAGARIESILWWSALPGASRHHWGTDLDVYDRAALPPGATLQLVPAEYAEGGPFERLSDWLRDNMHRYGFFRPYAQDRGGVSPEPWHLSFAPLALQCSAALTPALLAEALVAAGVEGEAEILAAIPGIHARYVRDVDAPGQPAAWA
jgi:LAS superfamily LD-carboxypeptidase LdcB